MAVIRFRISNFRGIVELEASPNGKHVTFRGKNAAGKTSAVDALWWALGGAPDGELVKNGTDRAKSELVFDGYLITRTLAKGKKPTLTVKSADGKATYSSPTALLAGFVGAFERKTFSARPAKEQAELVRKMAPGLDCGDIDRERLTLYDRRTETNREAKQYRAQADGVELPPAPAPSELRLEIDIAAVASKKADAATKKAANDRTREEVKQAGIEAERMQKVASDAVEEVRRIEKLLIEVTQRSVRLNEEQARAAANAQRMRFVAQELVDPDTTEIDREVEAARAHNHIARLAAKAVDERKRCEHEKQRLSQAATVKESESADLTAQIDGLDKKRLERIAAAKPPVEGLTLSGDVVLFDDGVHGPVEARQGILNDATCIKLDIAAAKALGYLVVSIRNAERLDPENRAEVYRFADEHGIQLILELRTDDGDVVEAVIEDGGTAAAKAPEGQQDLTL